jgi:hypothetical protein
MTDEHGKVLRCGEHEDLSCPSLFSCRTVDNCRIVIMGLQAGKRNIEWL